MCWNSLLFCHSGPRILDLVLGVQMRCSAGCLLVGDLDGALSVTASVIPKANPQRGPFFWLVGKLSFLLWFDFEPHTSVMDGLSWDCDGSP